MRKLTAFIFLMVFFNTAMAEDFKYPYKQSDEREPFTSLLTDKGESTLMVKQEKEKEVVKPVEEAIVLQGIIFSADGATVIINNEMYHEGDSFGKYTIKQIAPDGIIAASDGQEHFIKWGER